jgi:hypothetical protein
MHNGMRLRHLADAVEYRLDTFKKLLAQPRTLIVVAPDGVFQIELSLGLNY